MNLRGQSGFGLILLVAIIAVASILLLASGQVLENSMRQTQLRIDGAKAHYLAQAGVIKAAWDWYESNTATEISRRWAPLSTTLPSTNMTFKAGYDSAGADLHSNFAYYTSTSASSIQFVKNVATNAIHTSAGNSLAATLGGGVSVAQGNFLVVAVAQDGGSTANWACADTKGNTYTLNALNNIVDAANSNAVVRVMLFYAPVTTALAAGDIVTVSWTTNVTARAVSVFEFSNVDTFDAAQEAEGASTTPNSGNAAANYLNDLLVGAIAVEGPTGDTFTPTVVSPVWNVSPPTRVSTGHATAASNVTINSMYRIVSATGNYAASATITNRDWAATIAAFKEHNRWFTSGGNRRLRRWQVYNINSADSITLDKIKVSWTGGGAARLNDLMLNGVSKWPGGTATTGSTVDITNTSLGSGASWSGKDTYLQWDNAGPTDPVKVTCQFIFSGDSSTTDAMSHEVVLWDGAQSEGAVPQERSFTVTSTGQVDQTSGDGFKVLKTVKAAISSKPGASSFEITDWDEGVKNIP